MEILNNNMEGFSNWLEAVEFAKAKKIKQGLAARKPRKSSTPEEYEPTTFGVEIEVRVLDVAEYDGHDDPDWNLDRADNVQAGIKDFLHTLNKLGIQAREGSADANNWGVSEDEQGVVEIATKPLTIKEMPQLKSFLNEVKDEWVHNLDGGTSAHVHVGMPHDSDAFDLIAMLSVMDEKSAFKAAGTGRNFTQYADFNVSQWRDVYDKIEAGVYDNEHMMGILRQSMNKNKGTNISSFFHTRRTVEFRYLSSQVVNDIKGFTDWIEYFVMLPRIARTRKQVKFNTFGKKISQGGYDAWLPSYKKHSDLDKNEPHRRGMRGVEAAVNPEGEPTGVIYFTRLPGGRIRVDKDVSKVRQSAGKPSHLRHSGRRYHDVAQFMAAYGDNPIKNFFNYLKEPEFKPYIRKFNNQIALREFWRSLSDDLKQKAWVNLSNAVKSGNLKRASSNNYNVHWAHPQGTQMDIQW